MTGLPTLKPVLTFTAATETPKPIGSPSSGGVHTYVNINSSTLVSEPGVMGGDWINADPDGKHLRLDVRSLLETDDGAFISFYYKGIITVDEALQKCLRGAPDAKSTDFGNIFANMTFQTEGPKYKWLEDAVFVGSGRALVDPNAVQYKIGQVEHN